MARFLGFRFLTSAFAVAATVTLAAAQELKPVRIGISSGSMPAAVARFAKEMGLFQKNGLDATITIMENSSVATMGLISGSLNFISTTPTDVPVARSRGQDLVALASIYRGVGGVLVLAKSVAEKSGVAASAPIAARLKALDGLLIASTAPTSSFTFTLKGSAESVGVKINLTYLAQPAMVAALERGVIQGFIASAPFYGVSAQSGSGVIWISGPKAEFPREFMAVNALTLNAKRDYVLANPDLVARMRATFADFVKAVDERPAEVKAAISRLFPDVSPATLDLLFETELNGFRTKPLSAADMASEIAYLKASGADLPNLASLDPETMVLLQ